MRSIPSLACGLAFLMVALVSTGCKDSSPTNPDTTPPGPGPTPIQGHTILMSSGFNPPLDTVAVGDTVTWTNAEWYLQTSTSDAGVWDTGDIEVGRSAKVAFKTAGTYPYHNVHILGMKGTIVVK
jgi:hypothetical protein